MWERNHSRNLEVGPSSSHLSKGERKHVNSKAIFLLIILQKYTAQISLNSHIKYIVEIFLSVDLESAELLSVSNFRNEQNLNLPYAFLFSQQILSEDSPLEMYWPYQAVQPNCYKCFISSMWAKVIENIELPNIFCL